eukprot:scaffold93605_cov37-Tisochrysis_lutea.AAC.1
MPSSRGGRIFDLVAMPASLSKIHKSHTCEKVERPSSACAALSVPGGCPVRLTCSSACAEGTTQPCRGVPFFSMKGVLIRPIGRTCSGSSAALMPLRTRTGADPALSRRPSELSAACSAVHSASSGRSTVARPPERSTILRRCRISSLTHASSFRILSRSLAISSLAARRAPRSACACLSSLSEPAEWTTLTTREVASSTRKAVEPKVWRTLTSREIWKPARPETGQRAEAVVRALHTIDEDDGHPSPPPPALAP